MGPKKKQRDALHLKNTIENLLLVFITLRPHFHIWFAFALKLGVRLLLAFLVTLPHVRHSNPFLLLPVQVIGKARVPIIKFETVEYGGLAFDVSFDVANGPQVCGHVSAPLYLHECTDSKRMHLSA